VAALKSGRPGQVYTFAGESISHRQVNQVVSRLAGLPAWRLNIPTGAMLGLAAWLDRRAERTGHEPYYPPNLATYVFHDWQVDSTKARTELGFVPTPFEEGARQTLEWYRTLGLLKHTVRPVGRAQTRAPSSKEV
jgi:dihydroflavonol-4-reductase